MKNHYTKHENGLWLKSLLLTFFSCFIAISADAQVVDFGKMEMDKVYEIKGDFNDYKGYFVAEDTGTLTATASFSCLMLPYNDEAGTSQPNYDQTYTDTGEAFTMDVEKGKTYYLFLPFSMSDGSFQMTMNQDNGIKFVRATPEDGSLFDLSQGGLVSIQFNKPIAIDAAMFSCNQTLTEVEYTLQSENIVFDLKNVIYNLMSNGNLKPGEQFAVVLDGVHAENDSTEILGEDGSFVLTYTLDEMPIALDSTVNVENNPFLSYWMENDEKGIIKLVFDGELKTVKDGADAGVATITCGELEAGVGGYYHEEVPYTVNGKELTINLTNKLRRHTDMLDAEMPLEFVTIKVKDIRGANGKLAYFSGKGGLGSYTFDMPYKEVKAEPISEFTPGENTTLKDVESIEIWVSDYKTILHEGILFEMANGSQKDSVVVTEFEEVADTEYEGAYILNVKVPAAAKAAQGNVTVSFLNLKCIDGLDHSKELSVTYTSATGIETLLIEKGAEHIYQLNGVKVNGKDYHQLPNGLYIINGKKVMVCHQ